MASQINEEDISVQALGIGLQNNDISAVISFCRAADLGLLQCFNIYVLVKKFVLLAAQLRALLYFYLFILFILFIFLRVCS